MKYIFNKFIFPCCKLQINSVKLLIVMEGLGLDIKVKYLYLNIIKE